MWGINLINQISNEIKETIKEFSSFFSYLSISFEDACYTSIQGTRSSDNDNSDFVTSRDTGYILTFRYSSTPQYYYSANSLDEIINYLKKVTLNLLNEKNYKKSEFKLLHCDNLKRANEFLKITKAAKLNFIEQVDILAKDYNLILDKFNYYDRTKIIISINSYKEEIRQIQLNAGFYANVFLRNEEQQFFSLPVSVANYEEQIDINDIEIRFKESSEVLKKLHLDSANVPNGKFDVILSPELAGTIIHETIGHLSEADNFHNQILELNTLVSNKNLTVEDIPMECPGFKYDDEGILCKKKTLIYRGRFVGLLNNKSTSDNDLYGNGRSVNYRFFPICRMRQTLVQPGTFSLQELFHKLDNGLYLIGYSSGNTFEGYFNIKSTYGFYIKNGEISSIIPGVNITGTTKDLLNNITLIGNDLTLIRDAGGCDKEGQNGLPNEMKSPSLLIKNLQIGEDIEYV